MKVFLEFMFVLSLINQTFANDITNVYLREDNLLHREGSNIPFTGIATRIDNNVKWLEYNVKNGKMDGLNTKWTFSGTRKMHSVMYKGGIKLWQKSWTPSGKEFYGEYKNDSPCNGIFEEDSSWGAYFDGDVPRNGHGLKYVTFENGIENGAVSWYAEQKDERLLAEGTYKNGNPWQGQFVIPVPGSLSTIYLWEIKSFQAGVPDGDVYYYAAEMILTPETKGHIVYEMVKQKHSGIYKNGRRWQGMFIQRFPEKEYIWEQLFYEEGKIIRKEYTAIYSGIDNIHATLSGWLPVNGEKLPDNKSSSKSDNNSAK